MNIEDKLDNWSKYATAGQRQVLKEAADTIRGFRKRVENHTSQLMQVCDERDRHKARGDMAMEFIHMAMAHVDESEVLKESE